jgi:subfamily B ATP-binding cassette protein MsbA
VTELLGIVAFISILIPGAYMVLNETDQIAGIKLAARPLELAELATLYALLAGVLDPVRKLSGILPIMRRSMSAADRVFEVIDLKTMVPEPEAPVVLPRHSESIEFENVSFRYQSSGGANSHPLSLHDISLKVNFGEVVAIVGGNGSGKSTLTSLIPRLMDPTDGAVKVDGIDIACVTSKDLRDQIGIVTQDTMLFDDTVYNNILYGNPDADAQMVEEAIRMSHAAEFILTLPEGMNTRVGAKGQRLSGGQKQRISLARAILRNPSILILDEATSAIDAESENLIYKALREFSRGRTTFIITHVINQTFIDLIDRVVVLDRGRISAVGRHEDLLKTTPDYSRLLQMETSLRRAA